MSKHTAPPPRSPVPQDVALLLATAFACALAVHWGRGVEIVGGWLMSGAATVVCALIFGLPALAFTLERGLATPAWMLGLGAIAGALPLPLLGVSGVVGLVVRAGTWERAAWALERGVPLPAAGVVFWPRFLRAECQGVLMGICCALVCWLLMIRARPDTRAVHILLSLLALGALATVAGFLR